MLDLIYDRTVSLLPASLFKIQLFFSELLLEKNNSRSSTSDVVV